MTAPIGTQVRKRLETMRDAMVDLGFIWIRLRVGLRDTLGHHLRVAFLVASVLAVGTLHASSVLQEFATEGAPHDVVELLGDELVAILFVNLFLALANGTLSSKTQRVERLALLVLFGYRSQSEESGEQEGR
jgi:phosphatidylglycerophosphatase A